MVSGDFYSRCNQIRRELRVLWVTRPDLSIFFGTAFTLLSFYPLQLPGESQVFNVTTPYWFASLYLLVLERQKCNASCAASYANLPRDRATYFDARVIFHLTHALFLELVIVAGTFLKLNGGGITPFFRIYPELAVLPASAVLLALSFSFQPAKWAPRLAVGTVATLVIGWVAYRCATLPQATAGNNYLPPRDTSLTHGFAAALILLVVSAALAWDTRKRWCAGDWNIP